MSGLFLIFIITGWCIPAAHGCEEGEWFCKDGKRCIKYRYVCDGYLHCTDGSDEESTLCENWDELCGENLWRCPNKHCISMDKVCDKWNHCQDKYISSDEDAELCSTWICPAEFLRCSGNNKSICVRPEKICDGSCTCDDCLDEADCEDWTCADGFWKCNDNVTCIEVKYVCDSGYHRFPTKRCPDFSDEAPDVCQAWTCPEGYWRYRCDSQFESACIADEYMCKSGFRSCRDPSYIKACQNWTCPDHTCGDNFCVPIKDICDGFDDCPDGSDETGCELWECLPDFWKCADNSRCIDTASVCNSWIHCPDHSDENSILCKTCDYDTEWPCLDGRLCIDKEHVCDDEADCYDESDESKHVCTNWTCPETKWKCREYLLCIYKDLVCDGYVHCPDGTDEVHCQDFTCLEGSRKCADGSKCIKENQVCDGSIECRDVSDELCDASCLKGPLVKETIVIKCKENNTVCVPEEQICDSFADCPFGSDEDQCSCKDWNMLECSIQGTPLCIYEEWGIQNCSRDLVERDFMKSELPKETRSRRLSTNDEEQSEQLNTRDRTNFSSEFATAVKKGVDVICIQESLFEKAETIILSTNLTIHGNNFSIKESTFVFKGDDKKLHHVMIVDVLLQRTIVYLKDIAIHLINVTLYEVILRDIHEHGRKNHVHVISVGSKFVCNHRNDWDLNGGILMHGRSILALSIRDSIISSCQLSLQTNNVIISVANSSFLDISMHVNVISYLRVPSIIMLRQTTFISGPSQRAFMLALSNPYVVVSECFFDRISLQITSQKQHYNSYLFCIEVLYSKFIPSSKDSNGGALMVQSNTDNSNITLSYCQFIQDQVTRGETLTAKGGSLFVQGASVLLTIEHCRFINSSATESGSVLHTSHGVSLIFNNCTVYSKVHSSAHQASVIYLAGKVIRMSGHFQIHHKFPDRNTNDLTIIYSNGAAKYLDITIHCPAWYRHLGVAKFDDRSSSSNVSILIRSFLYECKTCPEMFYTDSAQENTLLYQSGHPIPFSLNNQRVCIKCPYGALCSGNNVVPRPNYWGYWHNGELVFQQCPAEYCCSGSADAPCKAYDYCAGHRTGTLCGVCQRGFSVSILTGNCVSDDKCQSQEWFWILAIIVAMAYVIWYTFKDEIFTMLLKSITIFKCVHRKKSAHHHTVQIRVSEKVEAQNSKAVFNTDFTTHGREATVHRTKLVSEGKFEDELETNGEKAKIASDKGYFGIVTYFVQMAAIMKINIEFSDVDKSESFLDTVSKNIGTFVGIDLSQLSFDVCPIKDLTTLGKHIYNFVFLMGIYLSWILLFASSFWSNVTKGKLDGERRSQNRITKLQIKLIQGLIEIIKYTYVGFCTLVFSSLVCTKLGDQFVWWHDATHKCLANWQVLMIIGGVIYIIPFPLSLFLGMKMLRKRMITASSFIICCIFPPFILYHILRNNHGKDIAHSHKFPNSAALEAILSLLQGPYRDDQNNMTLYWEAMVSMRRLLISAMTLVSYASIRMMIIMALSGIFLIQHNYLCPFAVRTSNHLETLSLFLLLLMSGINLLKASLTDSGVIPSGPSVPFFKGLEFSEKCLIIALVCFILIIEVRTKQGKEKNKQ